VNINREEFLKDVEKIVNVDSGSFDMDGLKEVAAVITDMYKEAGLYASCELRGEGKRPFITATTKDPATFEGKEKPVDIMFFGHFDTVFPQGTVAERPFATDGEKAYGPGAADMKAGIVMGLYLTKALREKYPDISIALVNNGDEEISSIDSVDSLVEFSKKARYAFDMEPGRISGNFVKCRKGGGEYFVKCYGKASHAGNAPQKGASAIREAGRCITEMMALNDYEAGITVNVGLIKGGTASNTIADYCEMILDVRFWTDEQRQQVERDLQAIADSPVTEGVKVEFTFISGVPPMLEIPETEKMVKIMEEEAAKLDLHFGFEKSGGMSDASFVSKAGVPVIDACGPCGDFLHSEKEYFVLDTIEERFALLFNTAERLLEENK